MAANLERKWRSQFVFMQDQVIHADDDPQGGLYHRQFMMDGFIKPTLLFDLG